MADNYMRMADHAVKDHQQLNKNERARSIYVAISSFAFALEVYLKSILFSIDERVVSGHDLEKLWNELPESAQNWLTKNFNANYKSEGKDWNVLVSFNPKLHDESPRSKIDIPGGSALDMIKGHRNAFSSGRYGYELPPPSKLKPVLYNVPGLQLLSWFIRALAHHFAKEVSEAKKANKGVKAGNRVTMSISFPSGPIERFPSDK